MYLATMTFKMTGSFLDVRIVTPVEVEPAEGEKPEEQRQKFLGESNLSLLCVMTHDVYV